LLQSHEILGWVAEQHQQPVGYLICIRIRKGGAMPHSWKELWNRLWCRLRGQIPSLPASVHLIDLNVSPWCPQHEVERALLEQLAQLPGGQGRALRIIVPEKALPVQLFLREAGYRASRVLREHYSPDEDGYLMERQAAPICATPAVQPSLEPAEVCGPLVERHSQG
jgi:hypothetical protein